MKKALFGILAIVMVAGLISPAVVDAAEIYVNGIKQSSGSSHDAVTLGTDADAILALVNQQLQLDAQSKNTVFAGPASGGDADPDFRALVDDDIPDDITITETDPNALLMAGTDNVKDSHIDWGSGAGQVDADDLSDGSTNAVPTLTQESNWDTAYGWGDHASGGYVDSVLDDTDGAVPVLLQDATAFTINDETPSVSGHSIFITANAATPTTISDFDDPSNGQVIFVIVNDASTTFDFTSSGLEGLSADYAATNGEMLIFVYASQDSQWHYAGLVYGGGLSGIPLDSDFGSNGLMERTGAGTYGIATEGTDYNNRLVDGNSKRMYYFTSLTGGGSGALDAMAVASIQDGDGAVVVTGEVGYIYQFDSDSTDAESSPGHIRPDDYSVEGVWDLVTQYAAGYNSVESSSPQVSLLDSDGADGQITVQANDADDAVMDLRVDDSNGDDQSYLQLDGVNEIIDAFYDLNLASGKVYKINGSQINIGNLAAGGNWTPTGTIDAGGATSLEIPNGDNPTTDANGEIAYDNDDDFIEVYDGAASRAIPVLQIETVCLAEPDQLQSEQDDWILWHCMAEFAPHGVTIVDIAISGPTAFTDTITLEAWADAAGTTQTTIEAVACSSANRAEDDGTLSSSALGADEYLNANLDDSTDDVGELCITWTYYVNPGD